MANLNVIYRIAADISGLQQGVDKAAKATAGLETMAKKAGLALGAAFTVTALVTTVKKVIDFSSHLTDLAAKTGITTTGLQKLQLAFGQSGISIDQVSKAAEFLANVLVKGDKGPIALLQKLGLNAADLKNMSLDQMFITVGDAIGKMGNKAEQIAASKTLLGRGGVELLSGLNGELKVTTDEFERLGLIISPEIIANADKFGDELGLMNKAGMVFVAQVLGPALPGLAKFAQWLGALGAAFVRIEQLLVTKVINAWLRFKLVNQELVLSILEGVQKVPFLGKAFGIVDGAVAGFQAQVQRTKDQIKLFNLPVIETADVVKKAGVALDDGGESAERLAKAAATLAESIRKVNTDVVVLSQSLPGLRFDQVIEQLDPDGLIQAGLQLRAVEAATVGVSAATQKLIPGLVTSTSRLQDVEFAGVGTADSLKGVGEAAEDTGDQLKKTFGQGFSFGAEISDTIIGALQGGGSAVASAAAKLGQSLATSISKSFGQSFAGGVAGGLLTSGLTFGLGAIASILMAPTTGSRGTLATRLLGDLKDAAGGMEELRAQAKAAGFDLDRIFQARSISEYVARIEELNEALGNQAVLLEDIQGGMDDLGAAIASNFGIVPVALRPAIEALLRMQGITEDQRKALENLLAGGETDFAGLTKMAEGYGISLDALGPKFQQEELSRKATKLVTDFDNLIEAGGDAGGVYAGMADEVSELVNQAKKYGVALPKSLEPIAQHLLEAGKLVDANGKKLDSLAGINFEDSPLQKSTDAIVAAIDRLGELLGGIPGKARRAADGVPENPFKKWKPPDWSMPSMPSADGAATGGLVTARGIQHLGGGGLVWPMQPRGTDTVHAMLTPGELVLPEKNWRALVSEGGQRTTTMNIGPFYIDGVFSEGDLEQTVRRQMVPIIARTIEDNVGGARTRFQEALG